MSLIDGVDKEYEIYLPNSALMNGFIFGNNYNNALGCLVDAFILKYKKRPLSFNDANPIMEFSDYGITLYFSNVELGDI